MRQAGRAWVLAGGLVLAAGPAAEPAGPACPPAAGLADRAAEALRDWGGWLERHVQQWPQWAPWWPGPGGAEASPVAERPLISLALSHRDELQLTAEQVSRLEGLRTEFGREAIRRDAEIRIAELDLAAILERDPVDLGKAEAKIQEVARLRADLRVARLRALEQGKAVLTAEQRARLLALAGGRPAGGGPRRAAEASRP